MDSMQRYGIVLTCLVLVGCSTSPSEEGIKIGVNFPLTGGLSVYGGPLLDGFTLGLEEVNAAGGVQGKEIQMVVEDNAGDPRTSIQAAQKLMDADRVVMMVTSMVGPAGAIAPLTEENHLLLLYAAATDGFAAKNHYVFKDSVDAYYDCHELGKEALRRKMKRVGLFGTIGEFTEDCKRALEEELTGKGELVLYETYSKGETDFRTSLTKIQSSKPDVLFLSAYADDCVVIWQQIQELGFKVPLMIPFAQSSCGEKRAMHSVRSYPAAVIALDFIVDKNDTAYQTFITHFHAKYHREPDMPFFTILAYDWAHYVAKALESCVDVHDKECVQHAMENVTYEGALGQVKFKETHATFRPRVVIEYKDGKWISPSGVKALTVE